jgi:AcrR family transcriptional regulator
MTRQDGRMTYLTERRETEKEQRRLEIIEAAERLYATQGWNGLTMDQLAREARLSRALLYVYFRDRNDLHLVIVTRAFGLLQQRFHTAAAHGCGADKIEAIGRAYMAFAHEFPHYFDACARFQAALQPAEGGDTLTACAAAGDAVLAEVVQALEAGRADGSIRPDLGASMATALTLWGFMHGTLQLMTTKSAALARQGLPLQQLADQAILLLRHALCTDPSP